MLKLQPLPALGRQLAVHLRSFQPTCAGAGELQLIFGFGD